MYENEDTIVFYDGVFCRIAEIRINPFTQSLHYGNSIFDGMRSYATEEGAQIFKATEHYQRFAKTASQMGLNLPYTPEELSQISKQLLTLNKLEDAYVRPLLFSAPNMSLNMTSESHLMIVPFKWGLLLGNSLVNLKTSAYRRPHPDTPLHDAKVGGLYVTAVMASSAARAENYHDALQLDVEGNVACASGANLFYEKDEVLYTPKIGHIVQGITRAVVIEMAQKMGVEVVEKTITPEELDGVDGMFLAGTATEIAGVATLDRKSFKMQWEDTIGFVISRQYRQLVTLVDNVRGTLI
ncbi:MAG: aminotransferase class IV [Bacteroidota bacterium]